MITLAFLILKIILWEEQNLYFVCEEIKVTKFRSTQSFDSKMAITSSHNGCIKNAQSINKQVGIYQIGGAESKTPHEWLTVNFLWVKSSTLGKEEGYFVSDPQKTCQCKIWAGRK